MKISYLYLTILLGAFNIGFPILAMGHDSPSWNTLPAEIKMRALEYVGPDQLLLTLKAIGSMRLVSPEWNTFMRDEQLLTKLFSGCGLKSYSPNQASSVKTFFVTSLSRFNRDDRMFLKLIYYCLFIGNKEKQGAEGHLLKILSSSSLATPLSLPNFAMNFPSGMKLIMPFLNTQEDRVIFMQTLPFQMQADSELRECYEIIKGRVLDDFRKENVNETEIVNDLSLIETGSETSNLSYEQLFSVLSPYGILSSNVKDFLALSVRFLPEKEKLFIHACQKDDQLYVSKELSSVSLPVQDLGLLVAVSQNNNELTQFILENNQGIPTSAAETINTVRRIIFLKQILDDGSSPLLIDTKINNLLINRMCVALKFLPRESRSVILSVLLFALFEKKEIFNPLLNILGRNQILTEKQIKGCLACCDDGNIESIVNFLNETQNEYSATLLIICAEIAAIRGHQNALKQIIDKVRKDNDGQLPIKILDPLLNLSFKRPQIRNLLLD